MYKIKMISVNIGIVRFIIIGSEISLQIDFIGKGVRAIEIDIGCIGKGAVTVITPEPVWTIVRDVNIRVSIVVIIAL